MPTIENRSIRDKRLLGHGRRDGSSGNSLLCRSVDVMLLPSNAPVAWPFRFWRWGLFLGANLPSRHTRSPAEYGNELGSRLGHAPASRAGGRRARARLLPKTPPQARPRPSSARRGLLGLRASSPASSPQLATRPAQPSAEWLQRLPPLIDPVFTPNRTRVADLTTMPGSAAGPPSDQ